MPRESKPELTSIDSIATIVRFLLGAGRKHPMPFTVPRGIPNLRNLVYPEWLNEPAAVPTKTPEPRHIALFLERIHAGDDFDGGLNGPTGEWYYLSIASDGRDAVGVTSRQTALLNDGVYTGVDGGTDKFTNGLLLYPSQQSLNGAVQLPHPPPKNVYLALQVIERDDAAKAKGALDAVDKVSKAVIIQQGGNPIVIASAEAAMEILQKVVEAYSESDHPITAHRGFNHHQNYDLGRFITLPGDKGSYAIISSRPLEANNGLFRYESRHFQKGVNQTFSIPMVTDPETPRLVAIHAKLQNFFEPASLHVKTPSYDLQANSEQRFVAFGNWVTYHYTVCGGNEPIEFEVDNVGGVTYDIMVTAVNDIGAAAYIGP
jgi:hypothetical protein